MEHFDDGDGWCAQALEEPALVADVLLFLCAASRRQLADPASSPPEEAAPSPAGREAPPAAWGSRGRRSYASTSRLTRGDKEEDAAAAATSSAAKESLRASPMTPLDYGGGSGSSESGGEEMPVGAKRSRPAADRDGDGRERKVIVAGERPPWGFRIPGPKPNRRQTKKKTIPELQAMERSLLDQREMLLKEVEAQKSVHAALVAENRRLKRLKLNFEPQTMPRTSAPLREDLPQKLHQARNAFVSLPDLNISLFGELD